MTITITTPTTKAGQLAYFFVEFQISNLDAVAEAAEKLTKPEDVYKVEKTGLWKIK